MSLDVGHAFDGLGDFPLVRVRFDNESFAERDRVLQADLERPFLWGHRQGAWKVGAKLWRKDKSASQRRWQRSPEEGTAAPGRTHSTSSTSTTTMRAPGVPAEDIVLQQLLNYDARETVMPPMPNRRCSGPRRLSFCGHAL